jgi:hypothetical protein
MYGQTNQVNPIPSISTGTIKPTNAVASPGDVRSRLWAYDLTGNTLYYVDSFTHEGSDMAISDRSMFVGCEADYPFSNNVIKQKNAAVISYSYDIDGNDTTTFTKTVKKAYRFVNEYGVLIGEVDNNINSGGYDNWANGLGNGLGNISDSELILDDSNGSLYYVDLTNFWSGNTIYSSADWTPSYSQINGSTYSLPASNGIDANGDPYMDMNGFGPNLTAVENHMSNTFHHRS